MTTERDQALELDTKLTSAKNLAKYFFGMLFLSLWYFSGIAIAIFATLLIGMSAIIIYEIGLRPSWKEWIGIFVTSACLLWCLWNGIFK